MKIKLVLSILGFLILKPCCQHRHSADSNSQSELFSEAGDSNKNHMADSTMKFMWRDMVYDSALKESFYSIVVNQAYLESMTDPERAALGYVATFIGNECWWDGKANADRSNLDCKLITALGLGYQCSDEHLGFLRRWFADDQQVLDELEKSNCPTTPYTATIQNTFDEISLTVKNDSIIVSFQASGVNIREQRSWNWSETDYFKLTGGKLRLVKKDQSEERLETFETSDEE